MTTKAIPQPGFTTKQLEAIELLARGTSKRKTAALLEVDRSTVYYWLDKTEFAAALEEQKRKLESLILDPTPFLTGLVGWKEKLPEIMQAVAETALDKKNPRQMKAAELILQHCAVDAFNSGPSDDEKVIQAFFHNNGWIADLTNTKPESLHASDIACTD